MTSYFDKKKMVDYKIPIVPVNVFAAKPFCSIYKNVIAIHNDLIQPMRALYSFYMLVDGILNRKHPILQNPEYDSFIDAFSHCDIGFLNQHCKLLGYAQGYFEQHDDLDENATILLFDFRDVYCRANLFRQTSGGVVQGVFEINMKDNAPSPNNVRLGDYEPQKPKSYDMDQKRMDLFVKLIQMELRKRPQLRVDLCHVFVTGASCDYYHRLQSHNNSFSLQHSMDRALQTYMLPITQTWNTCSMQFLHPAEKHNLQQHACVNAYEALGRLDAINSNRVVLNSICNLQRDTCTMLFGLSIPTSELNNFESVYCMFDHFIKCLEQEDAKKNVCDYFTTHVTEIKLQKKTPILPLMGGFIQIFKNETVSQFMSNSNKRKKPTK